MTIIAKEQIVNVKLSYIRDNYKVCIKSSKHVFVVSVRDVFLTRYNIIILQTYTLFPFYYHLL